jgi:ATP-binding cassette subfamily B protein
MAQVFRRTSERRKKQFGILLILVVLASLAEMGNIGALLPFLGALTSPDKVYAHSYTQPFISFFGIENAQALLLPLTLIFASFALLSGIIRLALLWFQTRLSHAIGSDLSMEIYRRTLYQPYSVHVARNSSEIVAGISGKVNGVVNSAILPFFLMLGALPVLAGILITLLWIEPFISVLAFSGFGFIYYLIILFSRKRLATESQRISRESVQTIKALQEGLGGIRDVLLDGTQAAYCAIYKNADQKLRRSRASVQIISGSPRYLIESIGMMLIAALAYVLSARNQGLASAIPVLGALALGAQRLLPVLQQTYASWANIKGAQDILRDILCLLNQPLPVFADAPPAAPIIFEQDIYLDNLSFCYTKTGALILDDINLKLPKGMKIGFIGETGSGKSTLLDVVMGLLEPQSGVLRIDGTKIDARNIRAWQEHIAHVPQVIFLCDATIAENIAFGIPAEDIDLEKVKFAAEKAQIAKTIENWPEQYRTEVGERGIRLSGGQRQRIGIARALYKNADVIVFDEATSALDNETEQAVMQAIDELNATGECLTILIIAHRLSTLKNCDRVVELRQGKVRQAGTYAEMTCDLMDES